MFFTPPKRDSMNADAHNKRGVLDWASFLAKHDPLWDRFPAHYEQGPFAGNGLLGSIVYADREERTALRFEIGRTDVYDHRDEEGGTFGHCRLPIGQVLLVPPSMPADSGIRLDLWNAEIAGFIKLGDGVNADEERELHWRCFFPSEEEVMVLEVTSTAPGIAAHLLFRPEQGNSPRLAYAGAFDEKPNYIPNPPFVRQTVDGVDVCIQPLLAGGDYATAWREVRLSPTRQVFYLSVSNRTPSSGSLEDAVRAVNRAAEIGPERLEAAHREWWHKFYPASFLSIPDSRVEGFYWIQLYKMASATRADRPALDLLGPWFETTRWPCFWPDLNAQLSYFPHYAANHLELGESLCRLLDRNFENLVGNAPVEYRHDSAHLGGPCNLSLRSSRLHLEDRGPSLHIMCLPWLVHNYWIQYRHSMDDDMLRMRLFPLLRRSVCFLLHLLSEDEYGRLHTPRSRSAEYGSAEDTNQDHALLRWGCGALIAASRRLGIEDPLLPRWEEVLDRLADRPVNENGLMVGKDMPFSLPHRHYSHLFGIFPLHVHDLDDPVEHALAERSVRHFASLEGDNCGFKFAGLASLFAMLGKGEEAYAYLQRCLETRIGPNTFYMEIPWCPTLETPFAAARALQDMLIQSSGISTPAVPNVIRIFPAMPSVWRDACFNDLRAEGAFLVSAVRKDGRTTWIHITSLAGEPCRIRTDMVNPILQDAPGLTLSPRGAGEYDIDLARGQGVFIVPAANPHATPGVAPVPSLDGKSNRYGLH